MFSKKVKIDFISKHMDEMILIWILLLIIFILLLLLVIFLSCIKKQCLCQHRMDELCKEQYMIVDSLNKQHLMNTRNIANEKLRQNAKILNSLKKII